MMDLNIVLKVKNETFSILQNMQQFGKRVSREQVRGMLLSRLGIDIPDREFRNIFKDMIFDGFPVGSSAVNGYFIVDSQKKFDESVNELRSKIFAMYRRIKRLAINVENKFGTHVQLELELSGIDIIGGGDTNGK